MRRVRLAVSIAALMLFVHGSAQATGAYPVKDKIMITATSTVSSVTNVVLRWPNDVTATAWTLYKRPAGTDGYLNWGTGVSLPLMGTAGTMVITDAVVTAGAAYEYRLDRDNGAARAATAHILAGVQETAIESRGKLILLVDNRFTTSLAPELTRLMQDMAGDGWEIIRHDVDTTPTDPLKPWNDAPRIKAIIQADYDADTNNVKAVFLFGHIPVPYSGHMACNHAQDMVGAHPADPYYGDMNGTWTDTDTADPSWDPGYLSAILKYHNFPGDGKFDPWDFPGDSIIELQVGRVDLSNLPAFRVSETELLRRYLEKDHAYRHRLFDVTRRALVYDGFDGETWSQDSYRNFPTFFVGGKADTTYVGGNSAVFSTLPPQPDRPYAWIHGSGGGGPQHASGTATTTDLANNRVNGVFLLLFGSYFGDWDVTDALCRAPLASEGYALTALYSQLIWTLHDMGLGRNIGYSVRRTQSLAAWAFGNNVPRTLMGDPTLRMYMTAPPATVGAATNGTGGVTVSWAASPDTVAGYHVYRGGSMTGAFTRLNGPLVSGTSYTDVAPAGSSVYMVRAVRLETTGSGSFYNPSQGAMVAYPTQACQVAVSTAGGLPQSAPAVISGLAGQHLTLAVPAETIPGPSSLYVCSWTGTGSVPSAGKGTNVALCLDQNSSIAWQWTRNSDSAVTINWPKEGGAFAQPASIVLEAAASDADGLIVKVEFYEGANKLATGTNSFWDWPVDQSGTWLMYWHTDPDGINGKKSYYREPNAATFRCAPAWSNVPVGSHDIFAVAYDVLGGATTSAVVHFTVGTTPVPPVIVSQPASQAVTAGQHVAFNVGIDPASTAPFSYSWRWEYLNNGVRIISFVNSPTHITPPAALAGGSEAGNGDKYSVVVSNAAGVVTSQVAYLTVSANPLPPSISAQPTNAAVYVGQSALFGVTASGTAPLTYQWRTNGFDIGGAASASYTTPATSTNNSGTLYSVVISNGIGCVTSVNALLTVLIAAPTITSQPTNVTVAAGQTAAFSVMASGTFPLYYQWRTNGAAVAGATASAYTTPAAATNNSGTLYSVVVSNSAGSVVSSNAILTVNDQAAGLPFSDTFEAYAPGLDVSGTNGWTAAAEGTLVTALTYRAKMPPGYPIPTAAHSRVLQVNKSAQNDLPGVSNQNVNVDFMVQPTNGVLSESLGATVQAGLAFDTQGVVQVWHSAYESGSWTQKWTALGKPSTGTSGWVRVSFSFDYISNAGGHTLFRPFLNGVATPTPAGVASPTDLSSPGSWYVCANSPAANGSGQKKISGFKVESDNPTSLDDFIVTVDSFAYREAPLASILVVR